MQNLGKLKTFFSFTLIVASFFLSFRAEAAVVVKTQPQAKNYEIGDQMSFSISIESTNGMQNPGRNFKPPQIAGLEYFGISTSSSTNISIVNGQKSSKYISRVTVNYLCNKEGDYTIPPMDLDIAGAPMTKAVKFKVYKKLPDHLKPKRPKRAQRRGNIFDQFFGNSRGGMQDPFEEPEPEFFLRVEVDKTEVYEGEQFRADWFMYTTPGSSLSRFEVLQHSLVRGFYKEDIKFGQAFNWKKVELNGKPYLRGELGSYALTPYNPGEWIIDEHEVRVGIHTGFFGARRKIVTAKSDPVTINVKALPDPKPQTFYGGVGQFKLDSFVNSQNLKVKQGEPLVFNIKVIGQKSNTKFIENPKLELPESFEVYDVKSDFTFFPNNESSFKNFEFTLIANETGSFSLPDAKLSFYNPETKEYYDQYVRLPKVKILENKDLAKIKDQNFIEDEEKENESSDEQSLSPYKDVNSYSLLEYIYAPISLTVSLVILILTLILGCVIFILNYKPILPEDKFKLEIRNKIDQAVELLKSGQKKKSFVELINAYSLLLGALSGKRFGVEDVFEVSVEELPSSLKSQKVQLSSLNKQLQELRFGLDLESQEHDHKLKKCIDDLEQTFKSLESYL